MMNVLQGTQVTRQLPDAGSGKRAGRPARREGLPVGTNGRRKTGRGGGGLALFQGRTQGSETGVREAVETVVLPSVSPTHTGPGQPRRQSYWSLSGQVKGSRAGRGQNSGFGQLQGLDVPTPRNCHVPLSMARRQQSPGDQG